MVEMMCPAEPHGASGIERLVEQALRNRLMDFELVAGESGWILKGRSRTYYVKQLAQQLVMRATDVPIVANRIEVSNPPER